MVPFLGSLVQLCCGEGGILQTNVTGVCGECSQCMDNSGFAPAHSTCGLPVYTAQVPVALQGNCAMWALGFVNFPGLSCSGPGSRVLHKTQTRLGLRFVPFPGPSSSGDQVHGEHTVPDGLYILITSPVTAAWVPGCTARAPSQMCCVSPLGG